VSTFSEGFGVGSEEWMVADQTATEEKLLDQITKMDARIAVAKTQMGDRDKTKDVALGTSKINYIVSTTRLGLALQLGVTRFSGR
jgi:hypothetical protein